MNPKKNSFAKTLFLLTQILLPLVLLLPNVAYAVQTPTYSVNPSNVVMTRSNYTIGVTLGPVSNLSGTHFRLSFNDGIKFLEVPAQGILLGDLFTGVPTTVTTGNYYLDKTARSYIDVLVELPGKQIVSSTTTKTVANITFNLMSNALPTMTSGLNLEIGEILLYNGTGFQLVDQTTGINLVSGQLAVGYLGTTLAITAPSSVQVEKPVNINSTLKDESGNPLGGFSVDYYVDSLKVGSALTDANGVSSMSYTPSTVGTSTVRAVYVGNQPGGKYAGSNSSTTLTVTQLSTSLALSLPASTKIGVSATFTATLKKDSTPMGGATISFSVLPPGGSWTPIASAITDSNGNAAAQYTFAAAGTYGVKAEYLGTVNYRASADSATLVLALGTTSVKVSVAPSLTTKVDQAITISSTLKDSSGNPLTNKNIDYYFNSQKIGSGTTDSSGTSSIQYAPSAESPTGGSKVEARFNGDAAFSSSSDSLTMTVSKIASSLSLTVAPATITIQQKTTLTATLQDESAKSIPNSNIDFYLVNGTQWTKIGTSPTGSSGLASLDYTPTITGSLAIRANYSGSYKYMASMSDQMSLAVNTLATNLALVVPAKGKINQQVTLVATLQDANQKAVSGATVQFTSSVSGVDTGIGSATTDLNGAAKIPFTPSNVTTYTIKAKFVTDATYAASSDSKTMTVDLIKTSLIVNAPTKGKVDDQIPIVATLSDETNQSVEGVAIDYTVASGGTPQKIGTQATNRSSIAVQNFSASAAGTYTITATFAGDDVHAASSQEVILTISKVQTTLAITLSNSTIKTQNIVRMRATLTDENNQPIERATIEFQVSETGGGWVNITTATTDFYGVATADYVPVKAGTVTIRAVYNGDVKYVQGLGSENDLTVTEDNPLLMALPWIAIVIVIVAVVAVVAVFVRRSRRKQPEQLKSAPIQDYGY
jgi:hypothetical protein